MPELSHFSAQKVFVGEMREQKGNGKIYLNRITINFINTKAEK